MFDLSAILTHLYRRIAIPAFHWLSFRVTPRGLRCVGMWTSLVVVYSLLKLLPTLGIADERFLLGLKVGYWLVLVLTVIIGLGLLFDYVVLIFINKTTGHQLKDKIEVTRTLNRNLSVQSWSKVILTLRYLPKKSHPLDKWLNLLITDNYESTFIARQLPIQINSQDVNNVLPAYSANHEQSDEAIPNTSNALAITYELCPQKRGYADFKGLDILVATKLGLLSKFNHFEEQYILGTHQARVLANFAQVVQGQLLGMSQKSSLTGILKQRRQGQGQDFHQIRNYSEGDSIRYVDWKASSRYHRLMTREYQEERDQQIIFLLDCGQYMRHASIKDDILGKQLQDGKMRITGSHLDQALNAMLLLAEVANEQGDATGFISFASDNDKVIPPKKGPQVITYLLNQSFDIHTSQKLPDYVAVARTVRQLSTKRSMIILITNTRQEDHTELTQALQLLAAKHVVILANLYEQDLKQQLRRPISDRSDALTYHTIQEYLNMRERLHISLANQTRIHSINCTPKELPIRLISQYLTIKSHGVYK